MLYEQLIELVKNKPELYDLNFLHGQRVLKQTLWNEIGTQLKLPVKECKSRWKSLRSNYNNYLKNEVTSKRITKYRYVNQMHFLKQVIRPRVQLVNGSHNAKKEKLHKSSEVQIEYNGGKRNENNGEHVNEVVVNEMHSAFNPNVSKLIKNNEIAGLTINKLEDINESASKTLMKYSVEQKYKEIPPHPIDSFFSSTATRVKRFNPADQQYIKTIIFSGINKIEKKNIPTQSHGTYFQLESAQICSLQPSNALPSYSIPSTSSFYHGQNYNFYLNQELQTAPADQPLLHNNYSEYEYPTLFTPHFYN